MAGDPNSMVDHPGAKALAQGELKLQLLCTMAAFFEGMGYQDIRARTAGYQPPSLLPGKTQHHCPDLTCIQNDAKATPIMLDVVTGFELLHKDSKVRWEVFAYYIKATKGKFELHFAVPQWDESGDIAKNLRTKLFNLNIQYSRVWAL